MTTDLLGGEGRTDGFRRPSRSARAAGDVLAGHGGRLLAAGTVVVAALMIVAHFARALVLAPYFPAGSSPWPAWIALGVVVVLAIVVVRLTANRVPYWGVILLAVAVAVPIALDLAATSEELDLGIAPTAAAAAPLVLLPMSALRETRLPLAVAIASSVLIAGSVLLQVPEARTQTIIGLAVAASAVLPALVATVAIDGFRRLVQRELDLSLVQSTVSTARSAVGMRASEELAQLDYDAETLLDDVGSGRVAIPLPPETAALAGSLAAGLRVRLIEGRTDTWLRHAITESATLDQRVTVDDPTGCAGLLGKRQREGLLLAVWLLVGRLGKTQTTPISVRLRMLDDEADELSLEPSEGARGAAVASDRDPDADCAITIEIPGLVRRHVDPATWDAVASVGTYRVVASPAGFRIDVDCRTEQVGRAGGAASHGAARPRGTS